MPGGSRCALAAVMVAAGCVPARRSAKDRPGSDEIVLYRDRALITQRVALDAPRRGPTTLAIPLPAGVDPGSVGVIDHGGLTAATLRRPSNDAVPGAPSSDPVSADTDAEPASDAAGDEAGDVPAADRPAARPTDPPGDRPGAESSRAAATPRTIELTADAATPGRFTVALAYATDRLTWDVAYTVALDAAHDRATVDGTLTIRNTSGGAVRGAVRLIDAELGAWRDPTPAQLRAALDPPRRPAALRDAPAHSLGVRELAAGETRLPLLAGVSRALRPVLVYDPVGTALDHAGAVPVFDPSLGAQARAPSAVRESIELARPRRDVPELPAGPARLIERRGDGAIAVVGEGRLFDPASWIAAADTIAIGAARGVVGRRERRDWGRDDDAHRLSEEFLITIDNARPRPVEVVVREHLYRGQNWTLAYQSVPAVKEGPQQIALRTTVPAGGRAKVLYVVVYTW